MKTPIKYLLVILLLVGCYNLEAQENVFSIHSSGKALSMVLREISEMQDVDFAYDADLFNSVTTNFSFEKITLKQFMDFLEKEYFIRYKYIDGTWVLVYNKPEIVVKEEVANKPVPKIITVSGYVKDKKTRENLLYCNVAYGNKKGCMTNELGFFSFELLETDSARIFISHLGYKPLDTLISAKHTAEILLLPSEIMMDAIVVKQYEKQVLQAAPQPEKIGFNPMKANNAPRMSNDDLSNALLFIPGINFIEGGNSGLSVRGGDPGDNLVLFDGIPVLETSHLLGNMSMLNSKFVQQAFVSRGGFDVEFGERVSGLIELTGKSGKNKRPFFELSANLLNSNVLLNIPLGEKFSVTTAWRRSYIDQWQNYLYLKLVDNSESNEIESSVYPVLKYQDVNTKISFHPSEKMELNVNLLYSDDHQSRDFTLYQSDEFYRNEWATSKNMGYSFNWNWQISPNWFSSVTAAYSQLQKELEDETGELTEVVEIIENQGKGKGKGKGLVKTKERTYSRLLYDIDNGQNDIEELRVNWKTEFKKGILRNQGGIGWQANGFNYRYFAQRAETELPIDSIVDDIINYYVCAFVQQHIQPSPFMQFRWGLRANVDLYTGRIYWQPRGGIEMNPLDEWSIYFSSGIYHQFLSNIKRIDSEGHFSNVWFLPNNDGDGVVQAQHYIAGTKFEKNGWFVNLEGFSKNTTGKNTLFAEIQENDATPLVKYISKKTSQRYKGIDLFLQKKHGMFNHMVAWSLSKTEEKIDGVFENQWLPGYNDRLHRLKITELVSWKNWNLTGSWNFATGLPVINVMQSEQTGLIVRSPFFSQLDFSLSKILKSRHFESSAGVSLLNVLNRKNIVEVDYLRFTSENGSLTVRSDVSALSFTPVFFINLKIQ